MTSLDNRIKARLLTYAADCYARGFDVGARVLVEASYLTDETMTLRADGRTWAEFQCASWRPYRTDYGAVAGWAYAILYVLAKEEAAP